MNKTEYIDKIEAHLNDSHTYEILSNNPMSKY